MNVVKSGRTTAVTEGVIDGISMTVSINYGTGIGVVTLTNQVHIVPRPPWPAVDYEVSMGGDSGSVWMEQATRRAVGLHFAGETNPAPSAENAICTPIDRVATEFNISFLPVICRPRRPFDDICVRYPALCRYLARLVARVPSWPPPWPPPVGPWPPGPGPDPGPLARGPQAAGCGCGQAAADPGSVVDEQALGELLQLLTELGREGRA